MSGENLRLGMNSFRDEGSNQEDVRCFQSSAVDFYLFLFTAFRRVVLPTAKQETAAFFSPRSLNSNRPVRKSNIIMEIS